MNIYSMKRTSSNNAEICIYRYFVDKLNRKKEMNALEYDILKSLYSMFPEKVINGWKYRSVKPISFNNEKVVMEKAPGALLSNLIKRNTESVRHAGIWLAVFHNNSEHAYGHIICVGEFTTRHLFMCSQTKTITYIDPGIGFGSEQSQEESIIIFLHSVLSLCIFKIFSNPKRSICSFVQGYFTFRKNIIKRDEYYYSLKKFYKGQINSNFISKNCIMRILRLCKTFILYTLMRILVARVVFKAAMTHKK